MKTASSTYPPLREIWLCVVLSACIGLFTTACARSTGEARLHPTVSAVRVTRESLSESLTFPAEFRPWFAVELHAKVAGFVKTLSVDLGSRVKAGDVLAELEIPLLAEDISGARALLRRNDSEVKRAEAAYDDAHVSFTRLTAVAKADPKLLAQQDLDSALEKDRSASAAVVSAQQQVQIAQAELDRLLAEKSDSRLVAPFDGVVTELDANPGDLVQGGTAPSGQGKPLVRLAETDRLRAAFPVSTSSLTVVKVGLPVEIHLDDGRVIRTKIARFSDDVSWATRTMRVEADVPNEDLALVPGMYASATITPVNRENVLTLPIQAIQRGAQPKLWAIDAGGILQERQVKIGLETSDRVEILSGVAEGETVLLGNPGALQTGTKVEPHFVATIAPP